MPIQRYREESRLAIRDTHRSDVRLGHASAAHAWDSSGGGHRVLIFRLRRMSLGLAALFVALVGSAVPTAGAVATPRGGAELWESRYNGPNNSDDVAESLAVSSDGTRIFVVGVSAGSPTGANYATAAYDAGPVSRYG